MSRIVQLIVAAAAVIVAAATVFLAAHQLADSHPQPIDITVEEEDQSGGGSAPSGDMLFPTFEGNAK
jgi:hypothetical protein